jgi:cytochrome c-type biogenesis protein CcmH/NrfG
MNITFWFLAGVLTGAIMMAAARPLARQLRELSTRGSRRLLVLSGALLAMFAIAGVVLYRALNPVQSVTTATAPGSPSQAPSMEAAAAQLQARLERDGGSSADWELLAKSYDFLGRSGDAARARAHQGGSGTPPDWAAMSQQFDRQPAAAGVTQ